MQPGRDDRRRAAAELFTGAPQPRAETPGDVACHAIKELGFRNTDFVNNRLRNLPHAGWGKRDGILQIRDTVSAPALPDGTGKRSIRPVFQHPPHEV